MNGQLFPTYFKGLRLFGCLHRPNRDLSNLGVVVVQPLFGEYTQFHRAFYVLAERLTERGISVLRYDHLGTGDSFGDLCDVTLTGWIDDVLDAEAFLREQTDARKIVIVGARLGATIALAACARLARVVGLVLWEPVWSGSTYLDELREVRARTLSRYLPDPVYGMPAPNGSWDIFGFSCPASLVNSIRTFEVEVTRLSTRLPVQLVGSARSSLSSWMPPRTHPRISVETCHHPRSWLNPEEGIYDVVVPDCALQKIGDWIKRFL